jgi:pseudoazurin
MRYTLATLGAAALLLIHSGAEAREWQIKMLNKSSDGRTMAFEPSFVAIQPGDTVKFVAADKGHNAESVADILPKGAKPFKGRVNEEIAVRFTVPGFYGFKCLPHTGMGMVGLIRVGRPAQRSEALAGAAGLPGLGKKNMITLIQKAS